MVTKNRRTTELQIIHVAKRELGLDDATYRDLLENFGGKRSAGELDAAGRRKVIDRFKSLGFRVRPSRRAGSRPPAPGKMAAKARALWLGLYHLGEVRDPAETAIDGYVKRITGKDSLRFADGEDQARVIETLKQWAERVGWHQPMAEDIERIERLRERAGLPPAGVPGFAAKTTLLWAQWRRLVDLGAIRQPAMNLNLWLRQHAGVDLPEWVDPERADALTERLGRWVRYAKSGKPNRRKTDRRS